MSEKDGRRKRPVDPRNVELQDLSPEIQALIIDSPKATRWLARQLGVSGAVIRLLRPGFGQKKSTKRAKRKHGSNSAAEQAARHIRHQHHMKKERDKARARRGETEQEYFARKLRNKQAAIHHQAARPAPTPIRSLFRNSTILRKKLQRDLEKRRDDRGIIQFGAGRAITKETQEL